MNWIPSIASGNRRRFFTRRGGVSPPPYDLVVADENERLGLAETGVGFKVLQADTQEIWELIVEGFYLITIYLTGAGSPEVDGEYTQRGETFTPGELRSYPFWNMLGEADNPFASGISGTDAGWNIYDPVGEYLYGAYISTTGNENLPFGNDAAFSPVFGNSPAPSLDATDIWQPGQWQLVG